MFRYAGPRSTRWIVVLWISLALGVFCDTEIVNFRTKPGLSSLHLAWNLSTLVLEQAASSQILAAPLDESGSSSEVCEDYVVGNCPFEVWFKLPSAPFGPKTLRVSWPASYPATFFLRIYTAQDLAPYTNSSINPSTGLPNLEHVQYARVVSQSRGVLTPQAKLPWPIGELLLATDSASYHALVIPFRVRYERLHMGVFPHSLLPTLGFILVVVAVAALLVRPITKFFEDVAESVTNPTKQE